MMPSAPLNILLVSTKCPWPPCDGGRLVTWLTLEALAAAGHRLALIAPADGDDANDEAGTQALAAVCDAQLVPAAPRNWLAAIAAALRSGHGVSVARHQRPALRDAVCASLLTRRPDFVIAEQLQSLDACEPVRLAGIPLLLRMHNVESSLWRQAAAARWYARPLAWEARRLQRDENVALGSVTVATLTDLDADALRTRNAAASVVALPPPFPAEWPAGEAVGGSPALVVSGSAGWWPNRQATQWLLKRSWPAIRAAVPSARLHVFGGDAVVSGPGVTWHPRPSSSMQAFPANAIVLLPLLVGSGIRVRILEAWARGLPVVASSIAARGLAVADGRELLIADTPAQFATAVQRLVAEPGLRQALVDAGRAYLRRQHDPARMAQALLDGDRRAPN